VFLTFFGKPRWAGSRSISSTRCMTRMAMTIMRTAHDDHHHARMTTARRAITRMKARWPMLVPLGVLSLGAVLAGYPVPP
jgi:NADH-quinone oxidoreductase subunit L